MSVEALLVLLLLAALCLWLTLFLFTMLDHFIYRGTYGHFLTVLEAIERRDGASDAGWAAIGAHMQQAKTRYLARYLSNAGSHPEPARIAAEAYRQRADTATLMAHASDFRSRRRARQLVALYALSRTSDPAVLPLLERALASRRQVVAYAALDMLDIHGTPVAAEVLLRALDSGVLPASRVSTHLEHFNVDLIDLYVSWLEGGHEKSRYWTAYLLGKSQYTERTASILEGLLSDPAADVRKIALSSLSALDAPQLAVHAQRCLEDPVFFVRTQAARILVRFPAPEVVRSLALRLSDESDAVQLAVKRSLVELGTVTLDVLPAAGDSLNESARTRIPEIINTIRSEQGADVADAGHPEMSDVR